MECKRASLSDNLEEHGRQRRRLCHRFGTRNWLPIQSQSRTKILGEFPNFNQDRLALSASISGFILIRNL